MLPLLTCLVAALTLGSQPASAADPQAGAQPEAKTEKAKKNEKKPKKEKKAKKKSDKPAPDEGPTATDTDAAPAPAPADQLEPDGKGTRVTWKQHPTFRIGSAVRIDLDASYREDDRNNSNG